MKSKQHVHAHTWCRKNIKVVITPIVDSMLKIAKNFVGFKPKMLVKIKS
jgi:hypothetical protein